MVVHKVNMMAVGKVDTTDFDVDTTGSDVDTELPDVWPTMTADVPQKAVDGDIVALAHDENENIGILDFGHDVGTVGRVLDENIALQFHDVSIVVLLLDASIVLVQIDVLKLKGPYFASQKHLH